MSNLRLSLSEITGAEYMDSVCRAASFLGFGEYRALRDISEEKVDFFPSQLEERLDGLLPYCGKQAVSPLTESSPGAPTDAFQKAFHPGSAPLSGWGPFRLGEDGRLALIGKSEHYQASLGHNFPGYRLLINAMKIGILNATHNNTRGHITRLLERELVRIANHMDRNDQSGLNAVVFSNEPHVLNRVLLIWKPVLWPVKPP